jgi:transposase
MLITFQYRIKPTPEQVAIMETWSELLRRHWNFALGQRLDWLNSTRCRIDGCSIVSEPIGDLPEQVDYYSQQSALKETKKLFKVNPHNTSQNCSACGTKVPKTLSVRLHQCPKCKLEMDRDENAAINVLVKALNAVGLTVSACGALVDRQAMKQESSSVRMGDAHVTAPA